MESNYTDNSLGRWFVSGCIAVLVILLCMTLMLNDSTKTVLDAGPLMELDYVVIEQKTVPKPKKIPRVQQKKKKVEPVREEVAKQVIDIPEKHVELMEESIADQPNVSTASEKKDVVVSETLSSGVQRIDAVEELDNTDFNPIYNPKPNYPVVAQNAQISGYVDIDLIINEQGKVESFTIVETRGHPLFAVETAKVLPRWRFPPPRIAGKKVRVKYVYRVKFTLN